MNLSKRSRPPKADEQSVIAFLTDFGSADHYVGTMKAVLLSVNPSATIVDITHEVQPQQIRQASYLLWAAYNFFPRGTVFVAIVDPGVGSKRRILAIRTAKYIFLAPDNMLLDFVLSEEKVLEAVEVTAEKSPYVLSDISSTFHGRDIFAPVAAYLSRGVSLRELGRPVIIHPTMSQFIIVDGGKVENGEILHIDRFGNVVTNIQAGSLKNIAAAIKAIQVTGKTIGRWTENYEDAQAKTPCLVLGSSGLVEIVVKNGSAEQLLKAKVGSKLNIRWS